MSANIANSVLNPALTKFAVKYRVPGVPPVLPRLSLPAGGLVVKVPQYGTDWLGHTGVHKRDLGANYEFTDRPNATLTEVVLQRWSAAEKVDRDDPVLVGASVGAVTETLRDKTAIIKDKLVRQMAILEAQALTNASNYTTSASPTNKWDTSTGNFYNDILTAYETIADAIGEAPDTLVIPRRVVNALVQSTAWTDKVKYSQAPFSTDAVINALKALFGFQKIIIPPYVTYRNSAGTLVDLYSDNVAVLFLGWGYNLKTQGAPIWGAVFEAEGYPKIYTGKTLEGTAILGDHLFKVQTFVADAGYLLTDVLT